MEAALTFIDIGLLAMTQLSNIVRNKAERRYYHQSTVDGLFFNWISSV
jgi:hypothetical protein